MSVENVEKLIKDHQVEFIDLRFDDMRGVQQHVTFPVSIIEPGLFEDGKMFDGSSIAGWKGINESDMVLLPDPDTAVLDPFTADPTLILTCDVLDPATMQAYGRCPRGIAKRAEAYLKSSGIAEQALLDGRIHAAPDGVDFSIGGAVVAAGLFQIVGGKGGFIGRRRGGGEHFGRGRRGRRGAQGLAGGVVL